MSSDSTPTETYGANSEEQSNQSEAVCKGQEQSSHKWKMHQEWYFPGTGSEIDA